MNKITFRLLLATALGLLSASAVLADQRYIEHQADQLECQMNDLRDVFHDQFRQSGVYRELRSVALDVRNDARRIERLARRGAPACDLQAQLQGTYGCLERLGLLVGEARYRSTTGLDRPLDGCTLHVDARLATARQTLDCISAVLFPAGPVVTAHVITTDPVPRGGWHATQRPDLQFYPNQYPHNGTIVPGNGSVAPGWNPSSPGMHSPELPRGNSIPEEIGPPLTRNWVPRSSAVQGQAFPGAGRPTAGFPVQGSPSAGRQNTSNLSRPVGVYGQRGNGIELGNNGVVLRLGGAAIQLR